MRMTLAKTTTHRGTEAPRSFWVFLGASVPLCVVVLVGCLSLVSAQDRQSPSEPIRLVYLYSDGNLQGTLKAFKALLKERPDLRGKVTLSFLTESTMTDVPVGDLSRANVLMLDTMNQQLL